MPAVILKQKTRKKNDANLKHSLWLDVSSFYTISYPEKQPLIDLLDYGRYQFKKFIKLYLH